MRALMSSCPEGTGCRLWRTSGVRVAAAGAAVGVGVVFSAVGAEVAVGVVAVAHGGSPFGVVVVRPRMSLVRARKARAGTAEEIHPAGVGRAWATWAASDR